MLWKLLSKNEIRLIKSFLRKIALVRTHNYWRQDQTSTIYIKNKIVGEHFK
jgi:hypothetical protein